MPRLQVIGFGALNLDLIFQVDESLGRELGVRAGEEWAREPQQVDALLAVLYKEGRLVGKAGGGSAANTVVALSGMGFRAGYVGKIGSDSEGEFIWKSLDSIDRSRILRGERSGICLTLLIGKDRDRSMIVFPNVNDTLCWEDLDVEYAKECDFLHLTSFVGDRPLEAQRRLAAEAGSEVKISFDPGMLYARRGIPALLPILKNTYICFPSEEEVEILSGKEFWEGSRQLLDLGVQIVVCTMGHKGSYVFTEKEEFWTPAVKIREVVDTTGAGDVFAAGFLAGLLEQKSLRECADLATKWAARSIVGVGRQCYPVGNGRNE
ncbi:ribokinase [Candidatus Hakubella thermalkaliphila]|uniref:Ribokinase n=2 Tax=Candidatus Hakubella thermalkaliphila TaxID=2754717 RepID=A0A6V8PTN6_9ACTN|nr:carbohydrate kinase family protein [Candidatus Hakubella thermalkaliphila]GFP24881.1 ribokinase [Candidatus Hakubella thermalkaliphila]GFP35510.1 ribokinase [Candidatus Hakubella thermalkaliphila]GFP41981.1 ribokinase [Candidatus Hakubella thermalkaliphila]